jgi:hypothetical protein
MTTVDFQPTIDLVVNLLCAGILVPLVSFAITKLLAKLHIDKESALGQKILAAAENGAALAVAKVETATKGKVSVSVKDARVAEALAYVQRSVPDTLTKLGVTEDHLRDIVTAKLEQKGALK